MTQNANFIKILETTPAEILPASCNSIVDHFEVEPWVAKMIKTKPIPAWRNDETKKLKRNCRSAERKWKKTKLTVRYEILWEKLKIYYNAVRCARTSHFAKLITDHKNNPKILFSTIDLLINVIKYGRISTGALCEDFADHFRSKIDVIRSYLLLQHSVVFNMSEHQLLSEETLESFALLYHLPT